MRRALRLMMSFVVGLSTFGLASRVAFAQAKEPSAAAATSEEVRNELAAQVSPCADQPRSFKELKASFEKGRRPLASEMTGSWVEIGNIIDRPGAYVPRTLNCSGVTQRSKLDLVLIADGYSIEVHAVGMEGPQTEEMGPDNANGIEFREVYYGGEVALQNYHCRLTNRGTLVCLLGKYIGAEFKKMVVEKSQLYEPEVPPGFTVLNPPRD